VPGHEVEDQISSNTDPSRDPGGGATSSTDAIRRVMPTSTNPNHILAQGSCACHHKLPTAMESPATTPSVFDISLIAENNSARPALDNI
jgi:hypothetical protein